MKLHILSDLHLGFAPMQAAHSDADLVVLAGDIDEAFAGVHWARQQFDCPVLYVPGNHEYYQSEWTMKKLLWAMRIETEGSQVHVLDRDSVEIGGIRFLGTTLWTDLQNQPFHGIECGVLGSDSARIQVSDGDGLSTPTAQKLFETNRDWLASELEKPFAGKTVVITHHAPSGRSLHARFKGNPWNACFITDMESLMGDGVDLWVHGHTHNSFDYRVKGTRVVCNPRGYTNRSGDVENPAFDAGMIVEL